MIRYQEGYSPSMQKLCLLLTGGDIVTKNPIDETVSRLHVTEVGSHPYETFLELEAWNMDFEAGFKALNFAEVNII